MEPIIGSALGSVVRELGSVAGEHVDCHINIQNDVDDLRKGVADLKRRRNDKEAELRMVDGLEKQVKEEVQQWIEDARKIEIEMLKIEEEVQNVAYLSRGSLGRRVRQKIQEVREIYDQGSFPEGLVIERPLSIGITLPTEKMVGDVDVKEKIWGYLRSHEVGIIGVCGIGGVGKTTVMKHIHNELLKESIGFTKIIWVTVSQSFSVVKLQDGIARKVKKSLPKGNDELERACRLMEIMKTMKYALFLDDVWDKLTLHEVGIPEPTIENGCKIVITSRLVDVCKQLGCQIVKVPPLQKQESLNLFLDKVGQNVLQIPNLEEILKLMLAECAGLPLAIVIIAGSMRGITDVREWRSALDELRHCVVDTEKDSEDEIFKRLKFSYDRLPDSVQECFLYCSLYPEDWMIRREDLIENWICEGLVEKLESRAKMHDRGHTILNRLENNCLLEKVNEFGQEGVKMHDVVRDMALHVKCTGPRKFMVKAHIGLTKIPEEDDWSEDLDKVSLMFNEIIYIPESVSPKCLKLSTLILEGNDQLRQISECFFANLPLLKLLDLSKTGIETLPNSIRGLKNLTALILRRCRSLERMPSLSKLKALKKLDLNGAGLRVAPKGIEMLENLEYLDLCCAGLTVLPVGKISKLFRLQYLRKHRIFSTEIRGEEATRWKMLEYFEGGFDLPKDFSSFFGELNRFGRRPSNYLLQVGPSEVGEGCFWKFEDNDILKRVTLERCEIGKEYELVLPDDLRNLTIRSCNTVADISIFMKNLTQLQTYHLSYCQGIKCVVSSSSSSSSSSTAMNNLEEFFLLELHSLRDIVKVEKTTASLAPTICPYIFSNLKHMRVYSCSKLKRLFPCELLQVLGLQNLEEIDVENCLRMEEIIGWDEEEKEKENQTTTTTIFTLPKLRRLGLRSLPALKRICPEKGVMVCNSLDSINIESCSQLKTLEELTLAYLLSLRNVVNVEKTTALFSPTICPHIFSNLKHLSVYDCSKLKKLFPCELLQVQGLQNLEEIYVADCLGMEEIIGWEEEEKEKGNQTTTTLIFTLPKLKRLELRSLPALKRICPEKVVMVCNSLISIPIKGCPQLQTLEELTQLKTLEKLTLPNLLSLRNVVNLEKTTASLAPTICPHVFCNLKHVSVYNCSKLKKLFPCELLQGQGFQNLEQIRIEVCLGMEEIIGWEEEGNQTTTSAIFTLPKLRRLELQSLPELKIICPERVVMACDSLNSITIRGCEKVKRIPLYLRREHGQPSLPTIKVNIYNKKEWWESVEWENPDDKNVLLPFVEYYCDTWVEIEYGSV